MRPSLLLITLAGLLISSCQKSSMCRDTSTDCNTLAGKWKMVMVKENATGVTEQKPASVGGDVVITFIPSTSAKGKFMGRTPSNEFGPDEYTLGADNAIAMPVMGMTKVAETQWGNLFVNHIRDARQCHFESGCRLKIVTANKTLTFSKL